MRSPYGKDVVLEFTDAIPAEGMGVGDLFLAAGLALT